jgi:acyl-CoA synthetase (AMP-forming)/AMP-acid ligase II
LVGVVHDAESRSRVAAATTPRMRWTLEIGDDYEASLASVEPPTTFGPRSNDDLYVIYTGGTTGAPKGVRWRMEDAFHACLGGGAPQRGEVPITTPGQIVDRVVDSYVAFPVPPLMHASGMWPTLRWLLAGGTVVLVRDFDPDAIWRLVEIERVNLVNIVADAMARPLFDALRPDLDLSSLAVIGSSGAPLSRWMNRRLAEALPGVTIRDIYGSSETGVQGWSDSREDDEATGLFEMQDTIILDPDTLRPIPPGSEATGRLARRDTVPLGYHDDLDGSLDTFVVQDGRRIALTGDLGRLHADGRVSVLGRGSSCINSGGEKIYPAEVENVLRSHPTVYDIVVVGVPDARWGEAVAAVIQPVGEADISEQVLRMYCADRLASYKVPKSISFVDSIERSAAGKPDVEWAKVVARRNQEGCEQ